jgi:CRP-like cAMP-binding protein
MTFGFCIFAARYLVRAERTRNRVLQRLTESDPAVFADLYDHLEPVGLVRGAVVGASRSRTEWSYFLESGVVSLVAATSTGHSVEVAIVGREGVAGIADALGQQPLPYRLVVQVPGIAYRVPNEVIREHILTCTTLHGLLMDYSQQMMHQLAQSALCNRFHTSVERLARWLLLTADRAETNQFELTHEFVAQMVGAPRSAVSESAATLREKGIIDYRRGVLTIRNAKKLHKAACECVDAVSRPTNGSAHRTLQTAARARPRGRARA